jgi:hypothetical protein
MPKYNIIPETDQHADNEGIDLRKIKRGIKWGEGERTDTFEDKCGILS